MVNPKKRSAFKEHCIDILISLPVKKVSKILFEYGFRVTSSSIISW